MGKWLPRSNRPANLRQSRLHHHLYQRQGSQLPPPLPPPFPPALLSSILLCLTFELDPCYIVGSIESNCPLCRRFTPCPTTRQVASSLHPKPHASFANMVRPPPTPPARPRR